MKFVGFKLFLLYLFVGLSQIFCFRAMVKIFGKKLGIMPGYKIISGQNGITDDLEPILKEDIIEDQLKLSVRIKKNNEIIKLLYMLEYEVMKSLRGCARITERSYRLVSLSCKQPIIGAGSKITYRKTSPDSKVICGISKHLNKAKASGKSNKILFVKMILGKEQGTTCRITSIHGDWAVEPMGHSYPCCNCDVGKEKKNRERRVKPEEHSNCCYGCKASAEKPALIFTPEKQYKKFYVKSFEKEMKSPLKLQVLRDYIIYRNSLPETESNVSKELIDELKETKSVNLIICFLPTRIVVYFQFDCAEDYAETMIVWER